jgi:hypothetical protein
VTVRFTIIDRILCLWLWFSIGMYISSGRADLLPLAIGVVAGVAYQAAIEFDLMRGTST